MSDFKNEFKKEFDKEFDKEFRRKSRNDHWWEDRTLPQKILIGTGLGIGGLGLIALFGWVIMALWNWLMPEIFGLPHISYWQAWGLFILSSILFKGMGGSGSSTVRSDKKRRRELRRRMQEAQAEGFHDEPGDTGPSAKEPGTSGAGPKDPETKL